MFNQRFIVLVLGCSSLVLAGCGTRTESKSDASKDTADVQHVTLHVAGMTERLALT